MDETPHNEQNSEANAKKGKLEEHEVVIDCKNNDNDNEHASNALSGAGATNQNCTSDTSVPAAATVDVEVHDSAQDEQLGAERWKPNVAESSQETTSNVVSGSSDSQSTSTGEEQQRTTVESVASEQAKPDDPEISFKLVFSKQQFDLVARASTLVSELRVQISELTGVPPANQKINFRATLLRDEQTVGEAGVTRNAKLMLIGSRPAEIDRVAVSRSAVQSEKEDTNTAVGSTPLSKQEAHRRILEKYPKPEDSVPGLRNVTHPLPSVPLAGMLNKRGAKVRLTFKLEADELWIGTNERTEKLPMHSIRSVVHEPIAGHEDYAIVGLQLGPTELSRYWLYWVPAQYVKAIRDTILRP